ncbi:MAG: hypothetical protein VXY78_07760 [Pseudomonadota bacterium]|nr:hypothetical protein [Pseudomonadota bacterium]
MKKPLLADPFQLIYEKPVHHRNLTSRPAKAEQADLQPDNDGVSKFDIPLFGRLAFVGLTLHPYPAKFRNKIISKSMDEPSTAYKWLDSLYRI